MKSFLITLGLLVTPNLFAAPVQKDVCKVLLSKLATQYSGECSGTSYPLITQVQEGSTLDFRVEGAPLIQILMSPTVEEGNLLKNYGISCTRDQITVTYNRMSDGMPVLQKLQVLDDGKLGLFNTLDSDNVSCILTPSNPSK